MYTESFWSTILATILGFLFAIIAQPLVRYILLNRQASETKVVLKSELGNFIGLVAGACFLLDPKVGAPTKAEFDFLRHIFDEYGDDYFEQVRDSLKGIAYREYAEAINRRLPQTKAGILSLKPYKLPFLEGAVTNLSLFSVQIQKEILWLQQRLFILNEELDFSMKMGMLTFDRNANSGENVSVIKANLLSSYKAIRTQSVIIVRHTDRVLKILDK